MFIILDYSSALEYSIIRRYTNIVYYYYYYISCRMDLKINVDPLMISHHTFKNAIIQNIYMTFINY